MQALGIAGAVARIEVCDLFLQDPDQLEHANHQQMIQTFPSPGSSRGAGR